MITLNDVNLNDLLVNDLTTATFARGKGDKDKRKRQIKRSGRWWTPNKPVSANDGVHKKVVLASKVVDGKKKYKIVRYGAVGYSDYSVHKDKARRARFMKRHKAIKLKSGLPAYKDKFQAAYWGTHSKGGTW
jgi:hypothetical protein